MAQTHKNITCRCTMFLPLPFTELITISLIIILLFIWTLVHHCFICNQWPLFFSGSLSLVSSLEWSPFSFSLNTGHSFLSTLACLSSPALLYSCLFTLGAHKMSLLYLLLALWTFLEQNLLPRHVIFLYEMWQNFSELERHWSSQNFSCWVY